MKLKNGKTAGTDEVKEEMIIEGLQGGGLDLEGM